MDDQDCVAGAPIPGTRRLHGSLRGVEVCSGPACRKAWSNYHNERQKRERAELKALRARVKELEAA